MKYIILGLFMLTCALLLPSCARADLEASLVKAERINASGQAMIEQGQAAIVQATALKLQSADFLNMAELAAAQLGLPISTEMRQKINDLNTQAEKILASGSETLAQGQHIVNGAQQTIASIQKTLTQGGSVWGSIFSGVLTVAGILTGTGGAVYGFNRAATVRRIVGGMQAFKNTMGEEERQSFGKTMNAATTEKDRAIIISSKKSPRAKIAQQNAKTALSV